MQLTRQNITCRECCIFSLLLLFYTVAKIHRDKKQNLTCQTQKPLFVFYRPSRSRTHTERRFIQAHIHPGVDHHISKTLEVFKTFLSCLLKGEKFCYTEREREREKLSIFEELSDIKVLGSLSHLHGLKRGKKVKIHDLHSLAWTLATFKHASKNECNIISDETAVHSTDKAVFLILYIWRSFFDLLLKTKDGRNLRLHLDLHDITKKSEEEFIVSGLFPTKNQLWEHWSNLRKEKQVMNHRNHPGRRSLSVGMFDPALLKSDNRKHGTDPWKQMKKSINRRCVLSSGQSGSSLTKTLVQHSLSPTQLPPPTPNTPLWHDIMEEE